MANNENKKNESYNLPVEDIADYIICIAQNNGDLVTNLKLQKLLYYAQAWFLVNNKNKKLFKEDIEAWQYGPVVPNIYKKYQKFGRKPITSSSNLEKDFEHISPKVKQYLNEFCELFLRFSATELVGMTHIEEPWIEAINSSDRIINTDTMYKFYSKMLNNE